MEVRLLNQPLGGEHQLGTVLSACLRSGEFGCFRIAVAWAKRSGLSRIADDLRFFSEAGGDSVAIIGIDEGGATVEGLALALELFRETWVFHDGARTFHPKLYYLEGSNSATLIGGSGNLTRGGLFTNFEAALSLHLDLNEAPDEVVAAASRQYFAALLSLRDNVRLLSPELLERLAAAPQYRVLSEETQNRRRTASNRVRGTEGPDLFGPPAAGLCGAPPAQLPPLLWDESDNDDLLPPEQPASRASELLGFWKRLSASDASTTSSPGQIIIPIAYRPFFEPLKLDKDETATGGTRQSSRRFVVTYGDDRYGDDSVTRTVADARAIIYEPAVHHLRKNIELRFTFRDQEILHRLQTDDILEFARTGDAIIVRHRPAGARSGRFGQL